MTMKGCKIWGFSPRDCPQFGGAECPATCSRFDVAELRRQTTAELNLKMTHAEASEIYAKIRAIHETDYYAYIVAVVRIFEAAGYRKCPNDWKACHKEVA